MPRDNEIVRRGDFTVLESDLEAAEDAFSERSKGSRKRDKATRAPIAPDFETWKRHQRGLDYPGVDTPTDRPRQSFHDAPLPGDTARDDGVGLSLESDVDSNAEVSEEFDTTMDNLADAIGDVFKP